MSVVGTLLASKSWKERDGMISGTQSPKYHPPAKLSSQNRKAPMARSQ